jgi:hypothetical protein
MGHLSLFEFKAKWEYWQKKCVQVLANEDFSSGDAQILEKICKVTRILIEKCSNYLLNN